MDKATFTEKLANGVSSIVGPPLSFSSTGLFRARRMALLHSACRLVTYGFAITTVSIAQADILCDDIKAIMGSSGALKDFAGAAISDTKWQAKKSLSGFTDCNLWKGKDGAINYSCYGVKTNSESNIRNQYSKLNGVIDKCLPKPEWHHTIQSGDGNDIHMFSTLEGKSGNVSIFSFPELENGKWTTGYSVNITIYGENK